MKIDLPVQSYNSWEVVEAEIVDVAPHVPFSFALHRCTWWLDKWCVTNIETGAWIGHGRTKSAAITESRRSARSQSTERKRILASAAGGMYSARRPTSESRLCS